jgi:hypothetical protein
MTSDEKNKKKKTCKGINGRVALERASNGGFRVSQE